MAAMIPDPEVLCQAVLGTLRDGAKYESGCTLSATGCALMVALIDSLSTRVTDAISLLSTGADLPTEYVLRGPDKPA